MKKIIVALAMVAFASVAQAAYVNWGASGLSYKSSSFYLFDAAKSADVIAALSEASSSTASTLSSMALFSGTTSTKGKATANEVNVGEVTSVFALVIEGTSFDSGVKYMTITDDISAYVYTPPASAPGNFASTLATTGTSGTMSGGGSVPEPTTGLLVLVGMAGLALKRKCA